MNGESLIFNRLSKRVDKLESAMKNHESQIDTLAEGVQKLHERIDVFEKRVNERFDKMATREEMLRGFDRVDSRFERIEVQLQQIVDYLRL